MANQALFTPNRALDANAYAESGATATFYLPGTMTTIPIYADEAGTLSTSNPVTADASGIFPQTYFNGDAKVIVRDAGGATLWTLDPVPTSAKDAVGAANVTFAPSVEVPEANVQDAIQYIADEQAAVTALAGAQLADPIINGTFDVWQRATTGSGPGYVSADRWAIVGAGGGTVTLSRFTPNVGVKLGRSAPNYAGRIAVSGQTGSNVAALAQYIEGVNTFSAETVTVLGWARRTAGAGNIVVSFVQQFGTGGSPSATVSTSATTIPLDTPWAPFAAVISVPDISGKVLGSNGDDSLRLQFSLSNTFGLPLQTITVDLWGIHILPGSLTVDATDKYSPPRVADTLARCQRYFNIANTNTGGGSGAKYAAGAAALYFNSAHSFPSTMRAVPTATLNTAPTYVNCSAIEAAGLTTGGFNTRVTTAALGVYRTIDGIYWLDAELT